MVDTFALGGLVVGISSQRKEALPAASLDKQFVFEVGLAVPLTVLVQHVDGRRMTVPTGHRAIERSCMFGDAKASRDDKGEERGRRSTESHRQ